MSRTTFATLCLLASLATTLSPPLAGAEEPLPKDPPGWLRDGVALSAGYCYGSAGTFSPRGTGAFTGSLSSGNTVDSWQVQAYRTERFYLHLYMGASSDFDLYLYTPECVMIASSLRGTGQADEILGVSVPRSGVYHVVVVYYSGNYGSYTISHHLVANDAGYGIDAPDDPGNPNPPFALSTGTYAGGIMGPDAYVYPDYRDWYVVDVPALSTLVVTLAPDCPSDFDVALYREDGTFVANSVSSGCASDTATCGTLLEGARVRIRVSSWSGYGGYDLSVTNAGPGLGALTAC